VAPSGATTLGISLTNGNGSTSDNGATKSGETIRGGGARASTSTHGPLHTFNLVVEFFHEL
jgi:hypothetical protein